jgi:basic membrane protein A
LPATRFVVLDSPVDLPNATGFVFDNEQAGYLAGYLSGLVEAQEGPRLNGVHVVSTIGGIEGVTGMEELLDGFTAGARRALPGITIRRAYSGDFVEQSVCEAIANRHIDSGADIVFAAAGTCSLGALSAVALRGVWGVGVDEDRSYLGDHILASAERRLDRAVLLAVRSFVQGTLPGGETVVLGLEHDVLGVAGISSQVPVAIRRDVARAAAALKDDREP